MIHRECRFLLLATAAFAHTPAAQLAADDAVRIREFYRLASQIQNRPGRYACTIVTPNYNRLEIPGVSSAGL